MTDSFQPRAYIHKIRMINMLMQSYETKALFAPKTRGLRSGKALVRGRTTIPRPACRAGKFIGKMEDFDGLAGPDSLKFVEPPEQVSGRRKDERWRGTSAFPVTVMRLGKIRRTAYRRCLSAPIV
jgi:hypothetical protein